MTSIKIYPKAQLVKSHRKIIGATRVVGDRDAVILDIIKKMRKLKMRLVFYHEHVDGFVHMQFDRRLE
jgi:hypothetical protein